MAVDRTPCDEIAAAAALSSLIVSLLPLLLPLLLPPLLPLLLWPECCRCVLLGVLPKAERNQWTGWCR
jgi:hypothetical protein